MKIIILSTKEFNMLDADFKEHVLSDAETTTLCTLVGACADDDHADIDHADIDSIKTAMNVALLEDMND